MSWVLNKILSFYIIRWGESLPRLPLDKMLDANIFHNIFTANHVSINASQCLTLMQFLDPIQCGYCIEKTNVSERKKAKTRSGESIKFKRYKKKTEIFHTLALGHVFYDLVPSLVVLIWNFWNYPTLALRLRSTLNEKI